MNGHTPGHANAIQFTRLLLLYYYLSLAKNEWEGEVYTARNSDLPPPTLRQLGNHLYVKVACEDSVLHPDEVLQMIDNL
jgi:hypothetical protein